MGKRTFVIGDIHGEVKTLSNLIKSLKLKPDDELIFLGDVVDKGPDTRETIDFLIKFSQKNKCTFVRGNHEEMMLGAVVEKHPRAQQYWPIFGGAQTMKSYGAETIDQAAAKIPDEHIRFLSSMVDAHITDKHVFVHASWNTQKPLREQSRATLRYKFMNAVQPDRRFGKTIVCGHSSMMSGKPAAKGNFLCIDTIEYGWLTAYELSSGHFYQAGKNGQTRKIKRAETFSQKRHVPKRFHI